MAGTDLLALTPQQQTALVKATAELVAAEMVDADRPEAHLNLGLLDLRRRELPEAEKEYRTALRLDPNFVPALVNLADLDRARGMDDEGAELLEEGDGASSPTMPMSATPSVSTWCASTITPAHSISAPRARADARQCPLRLCLCRGAEFERCGATRRWRSWNKAHRQHPADRDVLMALVSIARDQGILPQRSGTPARWSLSTPVTQQLRALVSELESASPTSTSTMFPKYCTYRGQAASSIL